MTDEQLKYWQEVFWKKLRENTAAVESSRRMVRKVQHEMSGRGLSIFNEGVGFDEGS